MKTPTHCIEKLEKNYQTWRAIQKNAGKHFNRSKEKIFVADVKLLFVIAQTDIFDHITDVQKELLLNQRKPERLGFIADIEWVNEEQKLVELERVELRLLCQQRLEAEKAVLSKYF